MTHLCSSPGHGGRLRRIVGRGGEQIGLLELGPVDEHLAVADLDGLATEADDPLDERRVILARPVGRRREDDDVAALVGVESRRQFVDQDVLLGLQRVLHRLLLDLVRLGDERLDDKEDDQCENECLDDLEEAPEHGSAGHKTRSIGAGPPPAAGRRDPA